MQNVTRIRTKVSSLEKLDRFLDMHGIGDKKGLHESWHSMPKPVLISKRRRRYFRDMELFGEARRGDREITRIIRIWQKGNIRYVLWNDKTVEICSPDNPRYNYLDKGNYEYGGAILLFGEMTDEIERDIRKHWKNAVSRHRRFMRSHGGAAPNPSLTLEEFKAMISGHENRREAVHNPVRAKEGIVAAREALRSMNAEASICDFFAEFKGRKFGIEGKKLEDYAMMHPSELGRISYWTQQKDIENTIVVCITAGIRSVLAPGEYKLWAGRFPITLKKSQKGRSARFWLEKKAVHESDIHYAMEKLCSMENRDDACRFLQDLEKHPKYCSDIIKTGLVMVPVLGLDQEIVIVLPVSRKGERFFFSFPETGENFPVKGGMKTLRKLEFEFRERPIELFEAYERLSRFMPPEKVDDLIEHSKTRTKEIKQKADGLLRETLEKNAERIIERKLMIMGRDRQGFVVKGEKKNYFVSKMDGAIFTYPEGRYVCIVDNGEGRMFCHEDRLVSRIYMLLNDCKFKDSIDTLNGDMEFAEDSAYVNDMFFDEDGMLNIVT